MGKLLILLLAVLGAYFLWRMVTRADEPTRKPRSARAEGERMVDCTQCGVHLPISEAVESQGRYFCSEEHRRLFGP